MIGKAQDIGQTESQRIGSGAKVYALEPLNPQAIGCQVEAETNRIVEAQDIVARSGVDQREVGAGNADRVVANRTIDRIVQRRCCRRAGRVGANPGDDVVAGPAGDPSTPLTGAPKPTLVPPAARISLPSE